MITNEILKRANSLLSNGKIHDCISLLETEVDNGFKARILILKNLFGQNKRAETLGTITREDYQVNINNVISKLTELLEELRSIAKVKIYFIGHSNKEMTPISFENEFDAVKRVVENSSDLILYEKVIGSLDDLNLLLAEQGEVILHFACHGNIGGLFLSDANGIDKYETNTRILDFLRSFGLRIKGIILNACLSENLGKNLANNICSVICMNKEIRDESSVNYAKFFYKYLIGNFDFEKADGYAKNALNLKADDTIFTVDLIIKTNI